MRVEAAQIPRFNRWNGTADCDAQKASLGAVAKQLESAFRLPLNLTQPTAANTGLEVMHRSVIGVYHYHEPLGVGMVVQRPNDCRNDVFYERPTLARRFGLKICST